MTNDFNKNCFPYYYQINVVFVLKKNRACSSIVNRKWLSKLTTLLSLGKRIKSDVSFSLHWTLFAYRMTEKPSQVYSFKKSSLLLPSYPFWLNSHRSTIIIMKMRRKLEIYRDKRKWRSWSLDRDLVNPLKNERLWQRYTNILHSQI